MHGERLRERRTVDEGVRGVRMQLDVRRLRTPRRPRRQLLLATRAVWKLRLELYVHTRPR